MKAIKLEAVGLFSRIDIPKPQISSQEVLIQVHSVGICASEVLAYKGEHPFRRPPVILGHEFSGIIVEIGEKIKNFYVGDRVTAEPQIACNECIYCRKGKYNLCKNKISLGTQKWIGPFAEFIAIPESNLIKLPEGISFDEGALIEPLAVGVHTLRKSKVSQQHKVVILGMGMIGFSCLLAAKEFGVEQVVCTDIYDSKLKIAQELGASYTINIKRENFEEETRNILPEGADIAIVTCSSPEAFIQSIKVLKKDGTIMVVALLNEKIFVPLEIGGGGCERHIIGVSAYVRDDFNFGIRILKKNDTRKLISKVISIEEIGNIIYQLANKPSDSIRVIAH